jgi:Uma2 family endonuclease
MAIISSTQSLIPAIGYSATLVLDDAVSEDLIRDRQARGIDQHDEVWEGVYVMSPLADDEHQDVIHSFELAFGMILSLSGKAKVRPGVNVSDREENWSSNFRAPDVVVFLNDTAATCHGAFWKGGPDFAVEVVSKNDRTREKLAFSAKIGMRELLIVDRNPWQLELLRLRDDQLYSTGTSTVEKPEVLTSEVIPFTFKLEKADPRPVIVVGHSESEQTWRV